MLVVEDFPAQKRHSLTSLVNRRCGPPTELEQLIRNFFTTSTLLKVGFPPKERNISHKIYVI